VPSSTIVLTCPIVYESLGLSLFSTAYCLCATYCPHPSTYLVYLVSTSTWQVESPVNIGSSTSHYLSCVVLGRLCLIAFTAWLVGLSISAYTLPSSRPKRTVRAPIRDDDPHYLVTSYGHSCPAEQANVMRTDLSNDPRTYSEAMACPATAEWDAACEDELRTFQQMGVYKIMPQPKDCKVMGSKWVFCIKRGPDGEVQKYKACVVAQGFTQIEGLNYDETFAPVTKFASFRLILALAAQLNLEIHQMDVKAAYLNSKLKEEIFMEPLPGFNIPEGMVLRLIKAVYGTKQGGHIWYEDICRMLGEMGYMWTTADHAVFVCVWDNSFSIIVLYVDNTMLVTIMDLWIVTYASPSYCSDPDSLPTHSDYHEVVYAY
jgi:Reverse transcriptase (RNA-dependent DNA polymerase)